MKGIQFTFSDISTIYEGLISAVVVYVYTDLVNWVMNYLNSKQEQKQPQEQQEEEEQEQPQEQEQEQQEQQEEEEQEDAEWLPYDDNLSENDPPPSPIYAPSFHRNNEEDNILHKWVTHRKKIHYKKR
jgi:uncharacterized membrane protein YhiD involved in acid resistance